MATGKKAAICFRATSMPACETGAIFRQQHKKEDTMNITSIDPAMLSLELIGGDDRGYDFLTDENIIRLKHLVPEQRVLSIYLDIRPETMADKPVMLRYKQGMEEIRNSAADGWSHEERVLFDALTEDIGKKIEKILQNPSGKGMALFASPSRVQPKKGRVEYQQCLQFSLPEAPADLIQWGDAPALTPLLILRDEYPETGVVLFDRKRVRFFLHYMGEAAEYSINLINPDRVAQGKAHLWHGYGEHNHHNWQEEHYRRYLRQAALAVAKIGDKAGWKWLILASPDKKESGHLKDHLPLIWQESVIGTATLPMTASLAEVRDAASPLVAEAERQEETQMLAAWEGEMKKPDGRAVAGIADTVLAAVQYRLLTLIAEEGFVQPGWRCNACGGLIADLADEPPQQCPYCEADTFTEYPDIVGDLAVEVISSGGAVEIIHHPDNRKKAHDLGMVGGLLRY
jgi:rubrerythrin